MEFHSLRTSLSHLQHLHAAITKCVGTTRLRDTLDALWEKVAMFLQHMDGPLHIILDSISHFLYCYHFVGPKFENKEDIYGIVLKNDSDILHI